MAEEIITKKDLKKEEKRRLKSQMEATDLRIRQAKAIELETKLQKTKEKSEIDSLNSQGAYGTVSEPRKSLSTYLRNQNKFEVSVVSILDRKAAILIRISTTVISGLIVFHEYVDANVVGGHIISIVLLIGLLISLILSILATKPFNRVLKKVVADEVKPLHPSLEENSFFMWDNCNLENYEKAMEKVIKSQDLQLGNQIRANYILARNNGYKAMLLDHAYNVFLLSFISAGIVFVLSRYSII